MKNTIYTFAVMIGLSAIASSALMAQKMQETGTIPFDFQVAGQKVAAGSYIVSRDTTSGGTSLLSLRGTETRKGIYLPVSVGKAGATGQSKLVFRKYGDRYFLAEVWFPEESIGHVYPASPAEKELAAATNQQAPEVTYVAMR